ncbi:histidine triad (HIT) family protein [Bacilli bacterium PM5-9]|nr:histidine triad (HIT) family protein [Bacilli bacterium PM5-9]
MEDCLFCKIVSGEIPSYKIYEDEDVLAFLDISQTTKGHTLVIPKKHAKDIYEIDDESMAKVYKVARKLANTLSEKLNANGINLLNNNKVDAGQTVFHYHVHLIPRYDKDDKFVVNFLENENSNIEDTHNLLK